MMARRKIVILAAGLLGALVLGAGLGGCKDLTFNGDMKGYLEYWTDTVSVASARWSASPEQQTAGGRTTVATNATITASLTISNPEGYPLESVVSHASSGPHAVEVSGPASGTVLGLTKVTAVTPTSLSVEVAPVAHVPTPASLALEHTDFTVKISPTRSETAMQSPNPLVLSLRYNTPPRMPLAVMENGSGGYRWPRSGDKWEAIPSTPLYYAWPQNKTRDGGGRPTDPDYVERFYIEDNGTSGGKLEAEAGLPEQGTLTGSDGTVYNIYKYDPTGTSVTIYAEDGEGVRGAGIISGLLHEVTLEGNGGLFGSSQSVTVYRSDGSSLTGGDLEVPTMPGFYLSGWTEGGNTVTFPRTVSSPVTLVAQWTANPAGGGSGGGSGTGGGGGTPSLHTITYSGNGDDGTGAVPKEQAKFSGGTITIEGNSGNLARTGYTFAGWNTEAGGTGTPYREGDSYTDDASVTLHAQWTANDYTVTLDDGGSGGSGSVKVIYGQTPPKVNAPTKAGHDFGGYYTQRNGGGTQYYDKDGNGVNTWQEAQDTTLYAYWTAWGTVEPVTFSPPSGDADAVHPLTVILSTTTPGAEIRYTTDGTDPATSSTAQTGSSPVTVTVTGIAQIRAVATASNMHTSAEAQASYSLKEYTVSLDNQGGSGDSQIAGVCHGASRTGTSVNVPTKTGYTFGGYWTGQNGGGTQCYDASVNGVGQWDMTTPVTTLYAQWTANKYTVQFDANDGSGRTVSQPFTYDQPKTLTQNGFSRPGRLFSGWNTRPTGGTIYTDGQEVKNLTAEANGTVTLYAQWGFVEVRGGTVTAAIPGSSQVFTGGTVTLESFWMSDHEVTQKEWHDVMGVWPARLAPNASWGQGDNFPVYCVGWYEALVYCNRRSLGEGLTPVYSIKGSTNPDDWGPVPASIDPDWSGVTVNNANGYRLPTSAEWVYAAAGGDPAQPDWSYTYAGGNVLDEVAWHNGNRGSRWAFEVKQKKPNRLGLYDMSGNVWEWCWDYLSDTSRRTRGGGTSSTDDATFRLACDNWWDEIVLNSDTFVGLRVVRSQ